ncbi:MAG: hypothetical protein AAF620_00370 [Bacteroidota bacterium]
MKNLEKIIKVLVLGAIATIAISCEEEEEINVKTPYQIMTTGGNDGSGTGHNPPPAS